VDQFKSDGFNPPTKPKHRLGDQLPAKTLQAQRKLYDAYVANVDEEFGQFFDSLSGAGLLDNAYFVLTSDHGEMFERGVMGHTTPLMYDPGLHIPLLISAPGQKIRNDVSTQTNSVDVLPTLLQVAGRTLPSWAEDNCCRGSAAAPMIHALRFLWMQN